MAEINSYLKKVAASSLLNSGASALSTALLLPLVIKQIGLDAYGLWAVLGVFIGIAAALDFGIWKSLVYLIPRGQYTPDQLLSSAFVLCAAVGGLFTLLLIGILAAGVPIFGPAIAAEGDLAWWVGMGGCVVVFSSLFTNLARGVLEALYKSHIVNIGWAFLTVLLYLSAAVLSRWSGDPRVLIVGSVSVYLLMLLAHVIYLAVLRSLRWKRPSAAAATAILRYGVGSFFADAPSILLGPAVLYLFVLMASDSREYALFDIALKIATLSATALGMLSTPFFAIVAATKPDAQSKVRNMVSAYLRITVPLGVAGWLAFFFFGAWLLEIFFNTSSAELHRASLIILAGSAAVAALEPITRTQMGLGRLGKLFAVRIFMLFTAVLLIAILGGIALLDRFSIACGAGFGAAAIGLVMLHRYETWGKEDSSATSRPLASVADGH